MIPTSINTHDRGATQKQPQRTVPNCLAMRRVSAAAVATWALFRSDGAGVNGIIVIYSDL